MEVIEHKEFPFPGDLEGRMNAMLNVVNTELKTIVLLNLGSVPLDRHDIKRRVRETTGYGIYLPDSSRNFEAYCHQTFYPIGAVAEETVLRDTGDTTYFGYCLTEAGKKYGLPICAFTLDYVVTNGMSMFPILGSTATPAGKKRSPLNRIKILKQLRGGNARIIDLEEKVGISDTSVRNGLIQLARQNLICFDSIKEVKKGEGQVIYEWIGGKEFEEIQPYNTDVSLTRRVASILKERGRLTSSETFSTFKGNRKDIRAFTNLLGHLVREGVAKQLKWKGTQYSEAQITDSGRAFLERYVDLVESALSDGPDLTRMQELYSGLLSDPLRLREHTRTAINLYKKISKKIDPVSREDRNKQLVGFIKANQGIRPVEIKEALGLSDVSHFLTPLVKSGILKKEKSDRESRYYVNE